ncbi:MAG: universal stress protein [Hyphomicrobiales bacterium]|nr:universal stress protein [Hyphomicrobiales bacterium]MCP5001719.1 universal stress protein [Hyphomicrobiales bacterium]
MAIRNILVAYNGSQSSDAAVHSAVLAHEKHDAHVTGLLAHASAKSRLSHYAWVPDAVKDTLDELEATAHAGIHDKFLAAVGGRIPADKLHWIETDGDSDATVADYARMYDLTVVGRRDALQGSERLELHPDRIALKSGRPVFVVPRDHKPEKIHEHAVLAWDGHRAATRALNDAMQILETKQKVTVLSVDNGERGKELKGIDVRMSLARHGIVVEVVIVPLGNKPVGETLLDFCVEQGAGMLVMGAYEHSLFREELFGGVTRYVLENAKLPLLISH